MENNSSKRKGFTLIETLVAITIVSVATAGPLFAANQAFLAAQISRDKLIASYLAQEGIEYVRMMRDSAYLAVYDGTEDPWSIFLEGGAPTYSAPDSIKACREEVCTLDPNDQAGSGNPSRALQVCQGACLTAPPHLYVLSDGRYTQKSTTPGAEETPFIRTIEITDVSNGDEKVISTVKWNFRGRDYSVSLLENLTPWQ